MTTISHLKSHLSSVLKQVKAGREIAITERNTPIAKLVPITKEEQVRDYGDTHLQKLIERGMVRVPTRAKMSVAQLRKRAVRSQASVVQALLEEREEGW